MGRYFLIAAVLGCSVLWLSRGSGATADTPTPTPAATPLPGWPGPTSLYLGRYRLTVSNNARWAHTGQLTVFMRTIRANVPPVISGIVALHGNQRSNVFYLTQFVNTGTQLKTTVNLGSYAGPAIGEFGVTRISGKTWKVVATIQQAPKLVLTFVRFSRNPHP